MGTSVYSSLLLKDLKRKKGDVIALRKELKELCQLVQSREAEVSAIETILREREPQIDLEAVEHIATHPKVHGIKWNQITIAALACLREANGAPVRSDDLTNYVIETTGKEINTRTDLVLMRNSVKLTLQRLTRTGRVVRRHDIQTSQFGLWSLAPEPTPQ